MPSPRNFRVAAIAFGIALAMAVLAFSEFSLRSVKHDPSAVAPAVRADPYVQWSNGPCFRVDGNRLVHILPPARTDGQGTGQAHVSAVAFPLARRPGVRRIAVVGESTGEMLEKAMVEAARHSDCRDNIEILECSTFAGHPSLAVARAKEVVAYSPDVLVVAIGHNFRLPIAKPLSAVEKTELSQQISKVLAPPVIAQQDVPSEARAAYEEILAAARSKGVQVLALELSSNLWLRPRADAEYVSSPARAHARELGASGDLDGAIAALDPKAGVDNALRAYERARFRSEKGDWAGARRDLETARDLDPGTELDMTTGVTFRASTQTNRAIAETVSKGGGTLLDVDPLFTAIADRRIPGWDIFWDHCHPNPEPLKLFARAVLRAADPDGAGCFAEPPDTGNHPHPTVDESYRRLTEPPMGIPNRTDAERFGWAQFPDNGGWRRFADGSIATLLRDSPEQAAAVLDRFDREKLQPLAPETHAILLDAIGEQAGDLGRNDVALWALEKAEAISPSPPVKANLDFVRLRAAHAK